MGLPLPTLLVTGGIGAPVSALEAVLGAGFIILGTAVELGAMVWIYLACKDLG